MILVGSLCGKKSIILFALIGDPVVAFTKTTNNSLNIAYPLKSIQLTALVMKLNVRKYFEEIFTFIEVKINFCIPLMRK